MEIDGLRVDLISGSISWRDGDVLVTKQEFEKTAQQTNGFRSLEVHFPRFGDVVLLDIPGKGRFVTSLTDRAERPPPRAASLREAAHRTKPLQFQAP